MSNDLFSAALSVTRRPGWARLKGIGRRAANTLERSCDRRRSKGRRDCAILLILLRLGLRAGEIAGLRLEDFERQGGEVVVRGKGRHEDGLRAPSDVGEAIAAELQRGRPRITEHREVSPRDVDPIGPLGTTGISGIVRCACLRAGVPAVTAHRLHQTVACQMVDCKVSLPEFAEILPHHSISSTAE
jgi:integrase/recombinase XerD